MKLLASYKKLLLFYTLSIMYILHILKYDLNNQSIPYCNISGASTRDKAFWLLQSVVIRDLWLTLYTSHCDDDYSEGMNIEIYHNERAIVEWNHDGQYKSYRIEHVTDWFIDWEPNTLDVEIS